MSFNFITSSFHQLHNLHSYKLTSHPSIINEAFKQCSYILNYCTPEILLSYFKNRIISRYFQLMLAYWKSSTFFNFASQYKCLTNPYYSFQKHNYYFLLVMQIHFFNSFITIPIIALITFIYYFR